MTLQFDGLEKKLGYRFRNRELLRRALTHRSWLSEHSSLAPEHGDNEQLEFLGDSILGFVVSEALVLKHPAALEGQLSQWKAHLVSATYLHLCSLKLGLGEYLLLGKGEERNGGRERKTLLANAFEALIAAIHIDAGIEVARTFIEEHVLTAIANPAEVEAIGLLNHKSLLQEKAQSLGLPAPQYRTIETSGPEHAKIFTVEAKINDTFLSRGTGTSKKTAGQRAAQILMQKLIFTTTGEISGAAIDPGTSLPLS